MQHFILAALATAVLAVIPMMASAQVQSADAAMSTASATMTPKGTFTKKRYSVKGEWEIVTVDGKPAIRFSEDFKTKNGPDLKVFLSQKPVGDLSGKTALGGAVSIGVLKSNKGVQTYIIPDDINLGDYKSVIVHCEAYSVLWGGFDIPQ